MRSCQVPPSWKIVSSLKTLIFKGNRLAWIYPVSRETIFGVLDHLRLHNYSGTIHPCIETLLGTAKPRRRVPQTKKFCVKMASFPYLDHISQSQKTFGNVRRKILTLLKTWQMRVVLVQNFKGITQEIVLCRTLIF